MSDPSDTAHYSEALARQREALAERPSMEKALAVQHYKHTMDDSARDIRSTFKVLPGGKG